MKRSLHLTIICLFVFAQIQAQQFNDAVSYMSFIGNFSKQIQKDYFSYASSVAHGKSARKVENRRISLIQSVQEASRKVQAMPPFNGNKALRDSAAKFFHLNYLVLNEDYPKIINMEEVAEQSYDAMEAYLLAQDKAGEKIENANKQLQKVNRDFASKNNITLVDSEDELDKKIAITNDVNDYHRTIYLIFFKCNKQEIYLVDALNSKNLNAIEQNKNTLLKYADEGLAKLSKMAGYQNDNALISAAKQYLEFTKQECTSKIPNLVNFFIKEDNFNKIKKVMESKKSSQRTQEDVDNYNKAVNEINSAAGQFNTTNNQINEERTRSLNTWSKSSAMFLDKYVPH